MDTGLKKDINEEDGLVDDLLMEDSATVYRGKEGLFIMTGCSHSGICNIIEYAKKVCNEERIVGVKGGFHLFEINDCTHNTIEYFKNQNIKLIYPCHCISFKVKADMNNTIPVCEVGVGLELEIV